MRFTPWKCPECGEPAQGTVDTIPGLALLAFSGDGNAEYAGETKVDWNNQATRHDEFGADLLECPAGHQWAAKRED